MYYQNDHSKKNARHKILLFNSKAVIKSIVCNNDWTDDMSIIDLNI